MPTIDEALDRLQRSAFRARFRLSEKDRQYIAAKGPEVIRARLFPLFDITGKTYGLSHWQYSSYARIKTNSPPLPGWAVPMRHPLKFRGV